MNAQELKFKKMGTAALLLKVEKLNGAEKEACITVLKQRNQDVSKWEVTAPVVNVTSSKVYEAEPEEELTPAQEKEVAKAEKEIDKTKTISLKDEAKSHIANFKKGSNGFIRIGQILENRKLEKLFDHELRMIIAVPLEKKIEKVETVKKPKVEKTEKAPKVEGEPKAKKEKFEGGSLEKYTLDFKDKAMTEDEIKALKTKREKVIACWFNGIQDIAKIAVIADYAKGNVRGILHLSNLK